MHFTNMYMVDIDKGPAIKQLAPMHYADKKANRVGAYLFQNGQPYSPGGTCAGTAVLSDGSTVVLTGVVSGNQAYVDLPQACYSKAGPIRVFVSCVDGTSSITTVFAGFGNVSLTETGTVIDPGTIIPSVSALIAAIEDAVESIPEDYSVLSDMVDALTHVDLTESGYIGPSGAETANADYKRTGLIPVSADSTLILDGFYTGIGASAYYFYAADKTGISGATSITARTVIDTIPSGAAYVRFSSRISNGETPVAYVASHVVDNFMELAKQVSAMSAATSSDVGKALKAKTVSNGKVTAWEFGDAGGGSIEGIQIVDNMSALAATTADKVLVLHDDSAWGTGGPCWFEKSATWTTYAYQRSDGSKMYPVPDQAPLPESHAPREQLMEILYTWVGNPDLHHGDSFNNDLFSTNCTKDGDDLFEMDCSAFISAVLLGITYENSRYVLGENADNIELQFMSNHMGPSNNAYMPKGGLQASEIAMWFAQQGRLFTFPLDEKKVCDMLQFGDIIFNSNDSRRPNDYNGIEHVRFVLGVSGNIVITVESTNSVGDHEQQNLQIRYTPLTLAVGDSGNIGPSGLLRVFARPNYRSLLQTPAITPYKQGIYRYNAFFLPVAGIRRSTDSGESSSKVSYGALYGDNRAMSTVDYLPVIPGSALDYVGSDTNSRGKYYYSVRCYEYDESYGLIKATSFAYYYNGALVRNSVTLGSTTKYVRFMLNYTSNSSSPASDYIYLRDSKDVVIQITPPT